MPYRNFNKNAYRYSHNGQEKDDEVFVGAHTADYWEYDSRILTRWNQDPLAYSWQSPYACYNGNSVFFTDPYGLEASPTDGAGGCKFPMELPFLFEDPSGLGCFGAMGTIASSINQMEPTKNNAIGVDSYLKILSENKISSTGGLHAFHGGGQDRTQTEASPNRYLYSKRWGWIDLHHFAGAANFTEYANVFGGGSQNVLSRGESHENGSAWGEVSSCFDVEDLVSNLIGSYFSEVYLNSPEAKGKDFLTNLSGYLNVLGFVEDYSIAPNYNSMPLSHHGETHTINFTYDPKYSLSSRTESIDKKMIEFKNNFIKNSGNPSKFRGSAKSARKLIQYIKSTKPNRD